MLEYENTGYTFDKIKYFLPMSMFHFKRVKESLSAKNLVFYSVQYKLKAFVISIVKNCGILVKNLFCACTVMLDKKKH